MKTTTKSTKTSLREGADSGNATSSRTAATHESHAQEPLIQPLPWTTDSDGYGGRVRDVNGFLVTDQLTHDEAEFIVRACNSHAETLSALRAALDEAGGLQGVTRRGRIRAAIAKAEGRS